jgi:hypothetical protein
MSNYVLNGPYNIPAFTWIGLPEKYKNLNQDTLSLDET